MTFLSSQGKDQSYHRMSQMIDGYRDNRIGGVSEVEAEGVIRYFDNTSSGRLQYPE